MNEIIVCPCCNNEGPRIIFRPHWSNQYHEFICGECKLELNLFYNSNKLLNPQLKEMYKKVIEFELADEIKKIKERVGKMTREQLITRLKELNRKKKK